MDKNNDKIRDIGLNDELRNSNRERVETRDGTLIHQNQDETAERE